MDFVPGAAYLCMSFNAKQVLFGFLHLPDCQPREAPLSPFFAGRGTGFDPQAVSGCCDPRDHVELVVVLPSFFEKVWELVVSRWKWEVFADRKPHQ